MKIIEFIKRNWVYLFLGFIIIVVIVVLLFAPKRSNNGAQEQSDNQNTQENQPIIVYGDTRNGHETHQKIVDAIITHDPLAVFHTGDLVNVGVSTGDWADFDRITKKLREQTKFYPALGNHELNSDLYFKNFDLPGNERWYEVDFGEIYFIVLDSNTSLEVGSEQYSWLEEKLKARKPQELVAAVFHHPSFSSVGHGSDTGLQKTIVPLFEKYDVDIVFNGHNHSYERSFKEPTYYIVTAGGGAPLYDQSSTNIYSQKYFKVNHFCVLEVEDNKIQIEVLDQNSNSIDSFVIE